MLGSNQTFATAEVELGLTRYELAQALGVAYPTLGKWARGERTPDAAAQTALRMLYWLRDRGQLDEWLAVQRRTAA